MVNTFPFWCCSLVAAAMAGCLVVSPSVAATCPPGFPSKPIRFVVGFGAGGGTDVIGRAVANEMERQQGWTVVVENKPGAGGGVLDLWLKSQTPDGYVVGVNGNDAVTINPAQRNVGYVWSDFTYLGSGMQTWYGLVTLSDRPYNDLAGLIAYAKEKGRATISVNGVNGEIFVKQLAKESHANLVAVPGTGAAEAMTSALGGHVDATVQGTLQVEQIKAGKMKQLASLIDRRVPYAPDSKTIAEQGLKVASLESHTIFMTPKGLPAAIETCLKQAIDEAVHGPEYKGLMTRFDNEALNLGEDGVVDLNRRLAAFYKEMLAP